MGINRNNGNKSLQGLKTRTRTRIRPQGPGQGKGPDPKDQDKDKDLKNVLKESLRTRTRINIPGISCLNLVKYTPKLHGGKCLLAPYGRPCLRPCPTENPEMETIPSLKWFPSY